MLGFYNISLTTFAILNRKTWNQLSLDYPISAPMDLAICHSVSSHGAKTATAFVEDGKHLSDTDFAPFCNNRYIITDVDDDKIVYNGMTVVNRSMSFVITGTKTVDVSITFEDNDGVTEDTVKDAITAAGGKVSHVEVVPGDDNTFIVSITTTEEEARRLTDILVDCSKR